MNPDPLFVRELASRLDADPDATVTARDIAGILDLDEETTRQTVTRLRREGHIDRRPGPRRLGESELNGPLVLTRDGWQLAKTLRK